MSRTSPSSSSARQSHMRRPLIFTTISSRCHRGLTVEVAGESIRGFAVCNQVRSFDLGTRVHAGSARYVETLGEATTNEIISRVLSVIDPEGR
jgi:hypothetical protein